MEREHELIARLISLSSYPILLALAGGGAVALFVTFVLPRFTELLAGSCAALPWSTTALLALT